MDTVSEGNTAGSDVPKYKSPTETIAEWHNVPTRHYKSLQCLELEVLCEIGLHLARIAAALEKLVQYGLPRNTKQMGD